MNNSQLSITIIDDGINQNLYATGELQYNLHITPELEICKRVGYDPFLPSHGTTCAAIIKKYAPDAVLSSIKILNDESRKGMKAQLIKALEWCADNGVRLVNLSLGTIDFKDFIEVEKAVNYTVEKGVIIVAACNNLNIFTCPASLESVIGVKCDCSKKLRKQKYIYNANMTDGVDLTACGSHKLTKYNGETKITSACNSFAAPAITALVYNMIKNEPNISIYEIKRKLKKKLVKPSICITNFLKRNNYSHKYPRKNIEIPILVLYNYSKICENLFSERINEIARRLTELFRKEGYNTILTVSDQVKKDYCKGTVPISEESIEKSSLVKGLEQIYKVFDPDMFIVPIDMTEATNEVYKIDIENHYEIDIKIYIYEDRLEVISEESSKTFEVQNSIDIDELYIYILDLLS